MHLRLVSPHPTPAVYLSLSFPFNAHHLPLPPTWSFSAQRLANDDLEMPNAIHFLDKSTWIISVLDQVIFDLSSLTITCHFVDGTKEEWPLVAMDCVRALENVVADVNSALSSETRRRECPTVVPQSTSPLPAPIQSPTRPKHRKSRSFFAPLVTMVSCVSLLSFYINFFSPRSQRYCYYDILVVSNKGTHLWSKDSNLVPFPGSFTTTGRVPPPSCPIGMHPSARSWSIRRHLSLVDPPRVEEKIKFL